MKILIIDDNRDIREAIKFYCESKNIDCHLANSGQAGLTAIRNNKYNLILLDLAMPEFTGLDVINNLKMTKELDKNPIVIFTASSDPKMIEKIKNAGVRERLKKPCTVDELEELIQRYNKN